jgi:predicted esterase
MKILERTLKIVADPIYNDVNLIHNQNIMRVNILKNRYYLHTIPNYTNKNDLILFYHGSRDIAWTQALEYTNLVNKAKENNYIVVYGQSSGIINKPIIHKYYGYASFGELYWEIRDNNEQFEEDLLYTELIIDMMKRKCDINNIYFIGHSNGGVFALLLALYMPNTFTKIVSHMGGIGYDPYFYLNFNILKDTDRKTPILFYTGENDIHRKPCEAAYEIFTGENFAADIYIEPNISHLYLNTCEAYILDWLKS